MLRFYMDHHVQLAVTEGLRQRGLDVITAFEDGFHERDDEVLLERATHLDRILYSQDSDLLEIGYRWQEISREFAGLVYSEQQGITIGQAVRDLEIIAHVLEPDAMRNRIEYLPL